MNKMVLYALAACAGLLFSVTSAKAVTYTYQCTNTVGELQSRLTGASVWTTVSSGSNPAPAKSGDIVVIDGTTNGEPCLGDVYVTQSGLTFENHSQTNTEISTDEIDGMVEVAGAHITINGLFLSCSLSGAFNGCSPTQANLTGLSTLTENGALALHDGAVVLLENSNIQSSLTSGVFAIRSSSVSIVNALISSNGAGGTNGSTTSGIFAEDGTSVRLGNPNGTGLVSIQSNGLTSGTGCPGFGIMLLQSSSLDAFAANIGTGTQNTCGQLYLEAGSSARLADTGIAQTTAPSQAVFAIAGSSILAETNTNNSGTVTISSTSSGALLLGGASTALLNAASLSAPGTSEPVVEAAASSTVVLSGGNIICAGSLSGSACTDSSSGTAIQIDHSSSLSQQQGNHFGYSGTVADAITGSAFVQVQSSMDLGVGDLPSTTNPSLTWSVPSGSCILVQQNSSFRMSGGIAITGASPAACALNGGITSSTIVIQQESNAFFNVGNGGTDNISGGGGVECLFSSFPNAHVSGKANITPSSAQPVIIGTWAAASSATSPGCLGP